MNLRVFRVAAACLILLVPMSAHAAPKAANQTLSKWFVHWPPGALLGEAIPGTTVDSALFVRAGVLTTQQIAYDDDEDTTRGGVASVNSVALTRIKSFNKNEYEKAGQTYYYIGIQTLGDKDISHTGGTGSPLKMDGMITKEEGYQGFVQFGPEQQDLRDDIYAKLCGLIGQKP